MLRAKDILLWISDMIDENQAIRHKKNTSEGGRLFGGSCVSQDSH